MLKTQQNSKVINKNSKIEQSLDWVGMETVKVPVKYSLNQKEYGTSAELEIFLSLDQGNFRGVDMAEIFFQSQEILAKQIINFERLKELSQKLLDTHQDRSTSTKVKMNFDIFLEKTSLQSHEKFLQSYPITLELINKNGNCNCKISFEILYASTCPCSESSARQQNLKTIQDFLKNNSVEDLTNWFLDSNTKFAYPHAQKSKAKFNLELAETKNIFEQVSTLIQELESCAKTSVQAGVRQVDEAEFTKIMGENLIFIEDIAKIFKEYINNQKQILNSRVELVHNESIHPQNAKVIFST